MTRLNVLILEDRAADAELLVHELRRGGFDPVWRRVQTEADYLAHLGPELDLILADYNLSQFDGRRALELLRQRQLDVPFVIVSGTIGEERAVACMQQGAADYVIKDRIGRLGHAVTEALRRHALARGLREGEARYRTLFDNVPVGLFRTTPEGRILEANQALVEILGYPDREALLAVNIGGLYVDPAEREGVLARQERDGLADTEIRVHRTDGTIIRVRSRACAIRDAGGRALYFEGMVEDITQRRHAEDASKALVEIGRALSRSLDPDVVAVLAVERVCQLLGAQSAVMYSFDPEAQTLTMLKSSTESTDPRRWAPTLPISTGAVGLAVRTRRPVATPDASADPRISLTLESRTFLEASGARALLAVPLLAQGRVFGALAVADRTGREFVREEIWLAEAFGDAAAAALENARLHAAALAEVAERQRAEAALRRSEARFRSLIESALDVVTVLSADGTIRYQSPALKRILGWSPEELLGRAALDLVHPGDAPRVAALLAEGIRTPGFIGALEFRFRHKDGSWRLLEAIGTNLLHEPDLEGIVVNSRDVTERAQAEEAVRRNEKLALMGELLAGVAHELNNPLTVVVGRAAFICDRAAGGPLAEQARKLSDAAKRCGRIVRNFLALARRRPIERKSVGLNEIVRDAVELLAYPLRVDDVEVVLDLDEALAVLWADPHQLHQVVVNLVTNAHQAMRATPARRLTLTTRVSAGGTRVVLEVADTGSGIAPEVRARIFEPFFTTKPAGQGTGLGLSLCLGVVETHGGTINVESAPGRGTRFVVELPAGRPAGAPPEEPARESSTPFATGSILVVDDEAEVADLLAEILSAGGHRVETAPNGVVALERVRAGAPDLILCDLRMPELDGAGFYHELARAHPELLGRLVFLTGDSLSEESRTFIEDLGRRAVPTLAKPFANEEVLRVVRSMLAAGGAGRG